MGKDFVLSQAKEGKKQRKSLKGKRRMGREKRKRKKLNLTGPALLSWSKPIRRADSEGGTERQQN